MYGNCYPRAFRYWLLFFCFAYSSEFLTIPRELAIILRLYLFLMIFELGTHIAQTFLRPVVDNLVVRWNDSHILHNVNVERVPLFEFIGGSTFLSNRRMLPKATSVNGTFFPSIFLKLENRLASPGTLQDMHDNRVLDCVCSSSSSDAGPSVRPCSCRQTVKSRVSETSVLFSGLLHP